MFSVPLCIFYFCSLTVTKVNEIGPRTSGMSECLRWLIFMVFLELEKEEAGERHHSATLPPTGLPLVPLLRAQCGAGA